MIAMLRRILTNRSAREEFAWVALNKLAEAALLFVTLKLLTRLLSKEAYAEYNLIVTLMVLVAHVALLPINRAYHRLYHGGEESGHARSAGTATLTWYAVATGVVLLLAGLISRPAGRWFAFEPWSAAAAGMLFVGTYWRFLGVEIFNLRRERRTAAIQSIAFYAATVVAMAAALVLWEPSATAALLSSAAVALVFAVLAARPLVRQIRAHPPGGGSPIMTMAWTFGAPYAAMMACGWVQGFADRYLVDWLMDREAAALYVAAFVVSGAPYMILVTMMDSALVPIAYQRCKDPSDPAQAWAGDRVMLLGVGVYALIGLPLIPVFLLFGPQVLTLFTSAEYALPGSVIAWLALGRFMQGLTVLAQWFFAIHNRMGSSLLFRAAGALLTVPICWLAIQHGGLMGAAVGTFVAAAAYAGLLTFGPGGCYWLIVSCRRRTPRCATAGV